MSRQITKKLGMWCLAGALFAAHLFFRTVAHADAPPASGINWEQVSAKHGECSIAFPSQPQLIQQTIPLSDGVNRLNYDIYIAPFQEQGIFLLLVATYPTPLTGGNEMSGLMGLLKGIVGHHPDNKLVYSDAVELFGHPALSFLVSGGSNYFRGQALMVGNKLFLIAMEGHKTKLDEKAFSQFIKSFKLTKEK